MTTHENRSLGMRTKFIDLSVFFSGLSLVYVFFRATGWANVINRTHDGPQNHVLPHGYTSHLVLITTAVLLYEVCPFLGTLLRIPPRKSGFIQSSRCIHHVKDPMGRTSSQESHLQRGISRDKCDPKVGYHGGCGMGF